MKYFHQLTKVSLETLAQLRDRLLAGSYCQQTGRLECAGSGEASVSHRCWPRVGVCKREPLGADQLTGTDISSHPIRSGKSYPVL